MGKLLAAMQYREQHFREKWTIFITTDHGRSATNGKGHGGQTDRERNTWILTNAVLQDGKILVSWQPLVKVGNARIFMAATNLFQTGGKDDYVLMTTVPVAQEQAVIDLSGAPGAFYKIVIETDNNYLNRWIKLN